LTQTTVAWAPGLVTRISAPVASVIAGIAAACAALARVVLTL
jgi:hypothetical protein